MKSEQTSQQGFFLQKKVANLYFKKGKKNICKDSEECKFLEDRTSS